MHAESGEAATYEPLVEGNAPKRRGPPRWCIITGVVLVVLLAAGGAAVYLAAAGRHSAAASSPPLPVFPPPPPPLPECHFSVGHQRRTRIVEFVNECKGDLMVNIQGFTWHQPADFLKHELPGDGGFKLAEGERIEHEISEQLFSGRIWARPNCTSPCNPLSCGPAGTMWCDTGNCPGANETTCRQPNGAFVGGLPPGPLLELTLCGGRGANPACYVGSDAYNADVCNGMPFNDFYDVSNVDGTSRVWASLEALRGRPLTGSGAPDPAYNCGSPRMPGAFDFAKCPMPLRIARNDTDAFGFSPNASVGKSIGCLSACNFMSLVGKHYVADRSAVGARPHNKSEPLVGMVTDDDIATTCCECGHGVDNGVCPAPKPDGTFPPPNTACIAGCSPFGGYPHSYKSSECSLARMPAIRVRRNVSIELASVQAAFKAYAPDAYSWQFDDFKSTFVCSQADYRVSFCPGK